MIQLILSDVPVDEVPGRLALATFFQDIRPLKGSTGLIDWRLNGRISGLIMQGRLSGQFSESLIMPSGGRLASRELMIFGLGLAPEWNEQKTEQAFTRLIQKIILLKSQELVTCFGDLARDFMGWRALLRSFVHSLSLQYGERDLEIICAEDPRWVGEARKRNMDFGPQVNLAYA